MSFKAQIATTDYNTAKNGKYRTYTSPFKYVFTKNKIHLPTKSITVLRPENQIFDKSNYTLIPLEKDHESYSKDSPFQAKFDNGITVNLVTTYFQTWALRFTHNRTLIQKEKKYIVTTLIGLLISVGTYFLGQQVGFKSGYQDGLKEAKLSHPDTSQSIVPQSSSKNPNPVDTFHISDTFHNSYKKFDTTK
jgi:hypothetical protein